MGHNRNSNNILTGEKMFETHILCELNKAIVQQAKVAAVPRDLSRYLGTQSHPTNKKKLDYALTTVKHSKSLPCGRKTFFKMYQYYVSQFTNGDVNPGKVF
jgi:hypothetical protein